MCKIPIQIELCVLYVYIHLYIDVDTETRLQTEGGGNSVHVWRSDKYGKHSTNTLGALKIPKLTAT